MVERCFDEWYSGNDFKPPLEARIHDYSDCIALVGLKNMQGELDIPTVITMLGDCYQEGNYEHLGNRTQSGDYTLTGNQIINGNLTVNGNIKCTGTISASNFTGLDGGSMTSSSDIISDGISLQSHTHSGVQSGGSNTGIPN